MAVGIIAFGSLLTNPGWEIAAATAYHAHGLVSPFPVEFARSSRNRDGAPTLVPCDAGSQVECSVIVLEDGMVLEEARDLLFRRERDRVGSGETCTPRWQAWLPIQRGFGPTEVSIYTALPGEIQPLTAEHLATLAVTSAQALAGKAKRDGITYLADALDHGIKTPLTDQYKEEILKLLGASTLRDAWESCTATQNGEGSTRA